jgi:hypothetical protein
LRSPRSVAKSPEIPPFPAVPQGLQKPGLRRIPL